MAKQNKWNKARDGLPVNSSIVGVMVELKNSDGTCRGMGAPDEAIKMLDAGLYSYWRYTDIPVVKLDNGAGKRITHTTCDGAAPLTTVYMFFPNATTDDLLKIAPAEQPKEHPWMRPHYDPRKTDAAVFKLKHQPLDLMLDVEFETGDRQQLQAEQFINLSADVRSSVTRWRYTDIPVTKPTTERQYKYANRNTGKCPTHGDALVRVEFANGKDDCPPVMAKKYHWQVSNAIPTIVSWEYVDESLREEPDVGRTGEMAISATEKHINNVAEHLGLLGLAEDFGGAYSSTKYDMESELKNMTQGALTGAAKAASDLGKAMGGESVEQKEEREFYQALERHAELKPHPEPGTFDYLKWLAGCLESDRSQMNDVRQWLKDKAACQDKTFVEELAGLSLKTITQRGVDYDSPTTGERSGPAIAAAFNAITGKDLTAAEVYLLLRVSKDVRQWQVPNRYHGDSAIDRVSYDLLIGEALQQQFCPPVQPQGEDTTNGD